MGHRGTEDGHDGISDELLDRAAEPLELSFEEGVVGLGGGPHLLGVGVMSTGGEAHYVHEQDRDDFALLGLGSRWLIQACAAMEAELRTLRVVLSAVGTDPMTPP